MSELTNYDEQKIILIAKHHPFSLQTVKDVYKLVLKSFDDTEKCLVESQKRAVPPEDIALSIRKKQLERPETDFSYLADS